MSSSLSKFSREAIVAGNRVFVSGSTTGLSSIEADDTIIFVTLSQGETMQQGRLFGPFSPSAWNVGLPAEGFAVGQAAVALGLVVTPVPAPPVGSAPGGYSTFTWSDSVTITEGSGASAAPEAPE
jgi:hypothetical protein